MRFAGSNACVKINATITQSADNSALSYLLADNSFICMLQPPPPCPINYAINVLSYDHGLGDDTSLGLKPLRNITTPGNILPNSPRSCYL